MPNMPSMLFFYAFRLMTWHHVPNLSLVLLALSKAEKTLDLKIKRRGLMLLNTLKQTSILLFSSLLVLGCNNTAPRSAEIIPEEIVDEEQNQQGTDTPPPVVTDPTPPVVVKPPAPPVIEFNPNANPANTDAFLTLPSGKKLSSIKVRGASLRLAVGKGSTFSSNRMDEYLKLKEATERDPAHKVQWTFMNLDSHKIIARSRSAHKKIFGASSSKIYVAATLLDKENGNLSKSQFQRLADMLVVSSNSAWTSLQRDIGDGSADKGRELNHLFTQRMGYPLTRGFQGYWGDIHGNELVPDEAVETLYDIYNNNFAGAETLWKIMYTSRTGSNRGKKYIPKNIFVGGKTGSYSGPTENPQTGKPYTVSVKNHLLIFNVKGVQYGLAILANSGTDTSAALLAGGLLREYTGL